MKNHLDLYSVPVNFTYRNYYLFPSICGGIISIIVELLLLAYLIYLLVDMSNREFPDLGISTFYENNPGIIQINEDPTYDNPEVARPEIKKEWNNESYWYFSFGIKNREGNFENIGPGSKFDISLLNYVNGGESNHPVAYSKCKKFGNGFVSKVQYERLKFADTECVNGGYSFGGIYGFQDSRWLELKVKLKGKDNIPEYKFEFYFQSRNLNITNFSEDISVSIVEEVFWDLLKGKTKISALKLSMDLIETNDIFLPRFIYRFYNKQYALTTKGWTDQTIDVKSVAYQTLLVLRIYLDRLSTRTERAFLDVISQFAMVGGLTGILFPIGFLFIFAIRNFKMNESMMNDCYSIVDPTKKTSIDPFDEFLMRHYNKLMRRFDEQKNGKRIKKTEDESFVLKGGGSTTNEIPKELYTDPKKKILIQINDDLNDNEGLTSPEWNALEKFFTLRRLEDLFNLTYQGRLKAIKDSTPFQSQSPKQQKRNNGTDEELACQYTENLQFDKIKQADYICYQFLYESCIYKIQPRLKFNVLELFHYFIFEVCCCKKKREIENQMITASNIKKNASLVGDKKSLVSVSTSKTLEKKNKINITNTEKKFAVYNGAVKKLGIDFDLINILKTIEGFDYFTQVFFEESQQVLFNSVAKPTIKIDAEEGQESKWGEQEFEDVVIMYHNLAGMINEAQGKLEPYQVRLLELMGRTSEEIETIQELVAGEDIQNKINHNQQDNVSSKNEINKKKNGEKKGDVNENKDNDDNNNKEVPKEEEKVIPLKEKLNDMIEMNDIDIENEIDAIFNKETPMGQAQQGKENIL